MTFKDQVRWSRKCGGYLFVFATSLFGLFFLVAKPEQPDPLSLGIGYLGGLALLGTFVFFVFGGLARPMHRSFYLQSRESKLMWGSATVRQRFTQSWDAVFWRHWLHIDPNGNDPDA
jgi:hypothetical protein